MKSLSKRAISLILAVLMIMDVFAPVAVVASLNSPQNNVKVLDEEPESETNSQNNEILIPATPQTNPEEDTLVPVQDPASKPSQNSSQKPAQKPAQNKTIPNQLYKSWTLVNPGKTTYSKGDILDLSKLSVRVTKTDGSVATLSYVQLLKDTNFDVIENVGNKIKLQPGKGSVTLVGPELNPITINIVVNDSTDKLQGANSNDELVPAIDPQANEENDELVVAENPNDKKTNIIEGNEQNSPEKNKETEDKEEKLEEEALKGSILDQVAGKETEVNSLGLKSFDPLKALGLNKEDKELTEEELEAGLAKVELPTLNEAPVSPVFNRSAYQSTGLLGDTGLNDDLGLDMSDEIVPEAVGAGNNSVLQLDGKKFNIITRFDTSTAVGPILKGQFFKIHLDDKLTVKSETNLEPIKYNNEVIATPQYNGQDNTITYIITRDIKENIQVPLNIPVDYNPSKITLDNNGEFTVINKVSGLGVTDPKDLIPTKVNKYGNVSNQIIEPNRKDVIQIINPDGAPYRVYTDAVANPVIKDKELVGFNWTIKITSDTDLSELGYKANFTTVKGSGLGEITSRDPNVTLVPQLKESEQPEAKSLFGINDSKHHAPGAGIKEITYNLYTPVTGKQSAYMMDISVILTKKDNKVGAKRVIAKEAYGINKIADVTPNRVGMNNRTTILGEFTSEQSAKWTVTDAVSTGDTNISLPLYDRQLSNNQTITTTNSAAYKIDPASGKMVEDTTGANGIKPVGTIAVYEYDANIIQGNKEPQTLGGVAISKYRDLYIDQHWNLPKDYKEVPAQTIKVIDPKVVIDPNNPNDESNVLGETSVAAKTLGTNETQRLITVPNVKYWNIDSNGNATMIEHKIDQTFPKENVTVGTKQYKYNENTSYYNYNDKNHFILNSLIEIDNKTPATFKVVKVDSKTGDKLQGARFHLLGTGVEVETDAKGEATFTNIPSGTYNFKETKAPKGYKLDGGNKTVTISDNGEVSVTGNNVDFFGAAGKTEIVEHNNAPNWPDYMNAMHYGKVDASGNVEFYLYLKPNAPKYNGGTDRYTRLDISIPGVNITDVKAYDVNPAYRQTVRDKMQNQKVDDNFINSLGNSVINASHNNNKVITGTPSKFDNYTGRTGYQIYFPKERFAGDWGFLVKVKANIGNNNSTNLYYDWLTDKDTANQTNLQKVVNLSKNAGDIATLTIKNEPLGKKTIEIVKFADTFTNGKRDRLNGAEFVLKDSEGNVIATKITGEDGIAGKASFEDFPEGTYILEEAKAPDGYEKNGVYFEVIVESDQVKYNAHFENSSATPVPGQDYYIEKGKEIGGTSQNIVTSVNQWLDYNEGGSYSRGERPKVWEAYRYESLKYHADITLDKSNKGDRFEIQFDQNLDFTQYFAGFPKIRKDGKDIADPYFDYKTNLLTYVFNENSLGGATTATIDLVGMIPSKYYAKNTGTYPFTITVQPNQTGIKGQTINKDINAFYDAYDSGHNEPVQNYYFREIYEENGEYFVDVISYYNVIGDRNPYKKVNPKTLSYNWITTKFQGGNIADWAGEGTAPRQVLDRVKIYRTEPNVRSINNDTLINDYMPLSMGYRAEQEPNIYQPVFNASINPNQNATISQNGITLIYDKGQINTNGKLIDNKIQPLKIKMPNINNGEGYVIEQRFKIPDIDAFNSKWRAFVMNNGNLKSAFASGANYSRAIGDQIGGEIPKNYKEETGLINKKYVPGQFKIIKSNQSDNSRLAGATFELTDANNNTIYRTSDKNGELSFTNLSPGKYTLKETKAPEGFVNSEKKWSVTVYSDGSVRIVQIGILGSDESYFGNNDNIVTMEVSNKPTGTEFRIYKKDSDGKALQGAEFTITKPNDSNFQAITETSNTNGVVEFKDLKEGTYLIQETKAPAGYKELNKKWVLVIGKDGSKKVYNYRKSDSTAPKLNSILEKEGVNWVNVAGRSLDGWNLYDNRRTGWTGNYPIPFKMGTRIVGINTKEKYVIQRYVINPEAANISGTTATIHREKPEDPNMTWYDGNAVAETDYQVFKLNKPVTGVISDIRLAEYGATDITNSVKDTVKAVPGKYREPNRLSIDLQSTDKPIVIDIKVPYTNDTGGVGTGMDWTENGTTYWKSDYYERANIIKEAAPVITTTDGQTETDIKGSYISEGSLDVTNDLTTYGFKLKKVKDNDNSKIIEGAVFKLTGPGEGGEERVITTGKDGIISFDKLKPGIYKLEEIEPAPGYEKADTNWTVRIASNGDAYIKDNKLVTVPNTKLINPAASTATRSSIQRSVFAASLSKEALAQAMNQSLAKAVLGENELEISEELNPEAQRGASDWQKVDPSASEGRKQRTQSKSLARTEITDINKVDKRFKQRFEFYESQYGARKREIQIYREPKSYSFLTSDTNIKVFQVNKGKTTDITSKITFKETKTGTKGLVAEVAATFAGTIIVELDSSYNSNFGIGLGSNYDSNKGNYGDENKAWVADSYDKEASINKNLVSSYNLNITNGQNGSVTASKTTGINKDEEVTLTINPNNGYELDKLKVAGVDVTNKVADGKYSFSMPASDVAVSATFREKLYSVWTQTVDHGYISANPNTNIKAGYKVTITANPDPGYKLEKITYNDNNGQEQTINPPAAGDITFTMPAYSVALTGHFVDDRPSYKVEVTQPQTGGTISANPTSVKEGDIVSLSASPSEGYLLDKFEVKDASNNTVTVDENNQFTMPKSNVTVTATFKEKPKNVYPISVEPSQNGSVSVKASATNGDTVTVTVNANEYYELDTLTVTDKNGTPVQVNGLSFTMPESAVKISATFKVKEITTPQEGEILIPKDGELIKITNKQTGLDLKIFKRDSNERPLKGGKFTLKKTTDKNYTTEDTTFKKIEGISDTDGKLVFTDSEGKEQTLALEPGYYLLEETESPSGYKKAQAPWKIHVYEDKETNQLKAEYQGPDETPDSFIKSDKALNGYDPDKQEQTPIKTTTNGIKYAARMTHINTEGKTYIQRIYIDTRNYKKPVNVQIKPVNKREELDAPGQPPKIGYEGKYGVKTAYRSTYEIKGLAENPDKAKLNDIFRNYTIANDDVSVVNTARWRPFDWGFDEDQLNLDPGVYYIDVEGFYDDNITDVGKIEMKVDFMTPRYFWQADGFNQDNSQHFKLGGSYQAGAETFGSVYEEDTYVNGVLKKKGTPTPWGAQKPDGQKYPNWLSKEFNDQYDRNWKYGIVAVPYNGTDKTIDSVTTSINIKPLYTSTKKTQVGPEGMDIVNDEETYNITFSKHGRDDKDEDVNSETVTKRRLEGAVFKLQEYVINGYKDVEGSTISSAFNGYFGFRGLKPGRYQLIEVKAPEGYKPINGPLLQFTVETIKTNSGKIVDPESGKVVDIKSIKVKFSEDKNATVYNLSDLSMVNPDDANQIIKVSSVDSKKINVKDSKVVNPTTNAIVNLNDLIIVTADGDGYPIKQIKIVDGSSGYISLEYDKANGVYQYVPEKSTSEKDGKLVDFVTSATAKNMGKIVNEKPGKGEVTIKKVDQAGTEIKATNQLPGAKFRITNKETGKYEDGTVGENGLLKFTGLNIGHYRLEELKSPDGYINNKQVWNFTVGGDGLDPYAKDAPVRRKDVSSSITLSESKLSVLNPNSKEKGLLSNNQKEMHPHLGEVFEFANKYTIDSNLKINPGDYFVLELSKNIDLHGIMETHIANLDIIADGVGTIAKADYDREKGTITYTFTNYADTYNLVEFSNKLKAYINLNKVPEEGDQTIGRGVVVNSKIPDNKVDTIKVVYDSMTAREKYQGTDGKIYEMTKNHLNLGSKIIKFNPDTGEFVHYYYVNRDRSTTPRSRFYYSSEQDIENLNIDYYLLDGSKVNVNDILPLSFGVNEANTSLPKPVRIRSRSTLYAGQEESFAFTGGLNENSTYLVKVTGKVLGEDKDGYVGHGKLQMIDYPSRNVTRWDKQYFFRNEATAEANLLIQAVNPENKIIFKKVDQDGNALEGAKFQLQYKQGENWVVDTSRDKTTGKDGVFEYTMLKPGSYRVMEITAPDGYKKAEDPVAEFDVDENGKIIRKEKTNNPVGGAQTGTTGPVASNTEEEPGITPIEIVNKKEQKISFVKVDANNKDTKLAGAEFKVFYKKEKTGEYSDTELKLYQNANGDKLVLNKDEAAPTGYTEVDKFTTGEDGKIEFKFYDSGYYALKEVKAPKGYISPRDYVKEILYKEGKLYELGQANLSMNLNRSTNINRITYYPEHNDEYTLIINPDNKKVNYLKPEGGNPKATLTLSGFNSNGNVKVYLKEKGKDIQRSGYVPDFTPGYKDLVIDLNKVIASIKAGKSTSSSNDISSDASIIIEIKETTSFNTEVKRDVKLNIKDKIGKEVITEDKALTIEASFASGGDSGYSGSKNFDSLPEIKSTEKTDGTFEINPIEVENKKAEYPHTGGMGTFIFTCFGASLIGLAYLSYRRRRGLVFDD